MPIQPSAGASGTVSRSVRIGFSPTSNSSSGSAHGGASGCHLQDGQDLERGGHRDRAAACVRDREPAGVGSGAGRDLEDAADPAADRDVRLDEVERPGREERGGRRGRLEDLAAGQRDRELAGQRRVGRVVVGRQRLLEPAEPEPVEHGPEAAALVEGVGPVAVGHPGHRRGGRRDPLDRRRSRRRGRTARSAASSRGSHRRHVMAASSVHASIRASGPRGSRGSRRTARTRSRSRSPYSAETGTPRDTGPQVVQRHRHRAERPAMRVPAVATRSASGLVGVATRRWPRSSSGTPRRHPARGTSRPSRRCPSPSSSRTTTESRVTLEPVENRRVRDRAVGEDEDLGPLDHRGALARSRSRPRLTWAVAARNAVAGRRLRRASTSSRCSIDGPISRLAGRGRVGQLGGRRVAAVGERTTPSMLVHSRRRYWNPDSSTTRPWNWRSCSVDGAERRRPRSPRSSSRPSRRGRRYRRRSMTRQASRERAPLEQGADRRRSSRPRPRRRPRPPRRGAGRTRPGPPAPAGEVPRGSVRG